VGTAASADDETTTTGSFGVAATGSNEAYGLALDARLVLPRGTQLGLALEGTGVTTGYFGGRTIHGAAGATSTALALVPLARTHGLALDLRLSTGVRYVRDVGARDSQYTRAIRSVTELGLFAHLRVGPWLLVRAGALCVFELELRPTVALADQAGLLSLGVGVALTDHALLFATLDAGGTYGFDGNNGKVIVRSALGLRVPIGGGDVRAPF
jgi:hypothetical protein